MECHRHHHHSFFHWSVLHGLVTHSSMVHCGVVHCLMVHRVMTHGLVVHCIQTHCALVHTTMVHLKQQWFENTENLLTECVHLQVRYIKLHWQYWNVLEDGNYNQEHKVTRSKLKYWQEFHWHASLVEMSLTIWIELLFGFFRLLFLWRFLFFGSLGLHLGRSVEILHKTQSESGVSEKSGGKWLVFWCVAPCPGSCGWPSAFACCGGDGTSIHRRRRSTVSPSSCTKKEKMHPNPSLRVHWHMPLKMGLRGEGAITLGTGNHLIG